VTSWAAHERAELVDALTELGPDAPTLCEGWLTKDMAAHVYVRERRPDASLGVLPLGPISRYTDRVMESVLEAQGYDGLLRKLREPAPILRVLHLDEAINTVEFFVHTEDVRRPNKMPDREMPEEFERKIGRRLAQQGRLSFRRAGVRVRLVPTVGEPAEFGKGPLVEVHGKPSELLLLAFNRKADAKVEYSGDPAGIETLQKAQLGL
jgi:uncharacterized protein (TIGR03085 family)